MFGTNKLVLNENTLREALQEWVDRRMTDGHLPGPKVVSMGMATIPYAVPMFMSASYDFVVILESPRKEPL